MDLLLNQKIKLFICQNFLLFYKINKKKKQNMTNNCKISTKIEFKIKNDKNKNNKDRLNNNLYIYALYKIYRIIF